MLCADLVACPSAAIPERVARACAGVSHRWALDRCVLRRPQRSSPLPLRMQCLPIRCFAIYAGRAERARAGFDLAFDLEDYEEAEVHAE